MKGGNHNPDGRPKALRAPVQVTIQFEAATLRKVDGIIAEEQKILDRLPSNKHKVTRSEIIRRLVDRGLEEE